MSELINKATQVLEKAHAMGAQEVGVSIARGSHTTLTYRDGTIEQASEASTQGMSVALMVNDRYSGHSTSDLRPAALDAFLTQAIAATQWLEEDPDRAQAPGLECGRGISQDELDQLDPSWPGVSAEDRNQQAKEMYESVNTHRADDVISVTSFYADGMSETARVMSNGFSDSSQGAWFTKGGGLTLNEGTKRPRGDSYYAARHQADLPPMERIAAEVNERARERLGAGPIASGVYPMLLQNRSAGRILGILGGPLSGASLFEGRSCLAEQLGQQIGSELFTIVDDPLIPRGLGSRPWDGDARIAKPQTIVEKGRLKSYYINTYYGRKLSCGPTTGGRSNWIIPPGQDSWETMTKPLPKAILVNGFLGGNANGITGDFSFGISGVLLENGVPTQSISEMNVTGNLLSIFHRLVGVANDPWEWSALRSPTLLFDDIQFSGT
jgi:PmbA protein